MDEIELGSSGLRLRPSFAAARAISSRFGGLAAARDRVDRQDLEAAAAIVAEGAGKPLDDVIEQVYVTGLDALNDPLGRFLDALADGGRVAA